MCPEIEFSKCCASNSNLTARTQLTLLRVLVTTQGQALHLQLSCQLKLSSRALPTQSWVENEHFHLIRLRMDSPLNWLIEMCTIWSHVAIPVMTRLGIAERIWNCQTFCSFQSKGPSHKISHLNNVRNQKLLSSKQLSPLIL